MSEQNNFPEIIISRDMAPAIYVAGGLNQFIKQIKSSVNEVPDLSTKKGRDRVASLAAQVSRSKTAVEKPGREYLRHLKELPKVIEVELRSFVTECDAIRDEVRRPLTEWEDEQERLRQEEAVRQQAIKDAEKREADHEIALLMNEKFDRDAAEAKAEAQRQQAARDEEIRRQAVEQARIESEQAAQRERDAAAKREADLVAAKAKAEADAKAARELAELEAKAAKERAERQAMEASERAEREKQAAIDAERKKAQDAENARIAAEQKKSAEDAQRAADKKHRDAVFLAMRDDLIEHAGLSEAQTKAVILALLNGKIRNQKINF